MLTQPTYRVQGEPGQAVFQGRPRPAHRNDHQRTQGFRREQGPQPVALPGADRSSDQPTSVGRPTGQPQLSFVARECRTGRPPDRHRGRSTRPGLRFGQLRVMACWWRSPRFSRRPRVSRTAACDHKWLISKAWPMTSTPQASSLTICAVCASRASSGACLTPTATCSRPMVARSPLSLCLPACRLFRPGWVSDLSVPIPSALAEALSQVDWHRLLAG